MASDYEILRKANEALLKAKEALSKANETLNRADEALVKANDVLLRGNGPPLGAIQTDAPATVLATATANKSDPAGLTADPAAMEGLIMHNAELLFAMLHKDQTPALHLEVYGQEPIIQACIDNLNAGDHIVFVKGEVVEEFEAAMESLLHVTRWLLTENM